ncbi:hypothetical protein [Bacillus sp. AFS033286]|uniref:hypothetical protein n=1 Tax=Bacillus sp. AFS033286 TaxID=2033498 RepID=UPI000BFD71A7|nr:hypothetical protein [Bacillus sp. AFS033286]PGX02673.1 hypothetical protein COE07_24105 [Bacillus sp. AFS033286]
MSDFLTLLFTFIVGFFMMQFLSYQFAKKNIHKYKEIKWVHMLLDMMVKKGPRLDFFDFVCIVLVCIIWKVSVYSFI